MPSEEVRLFTCLVLVVVLCGAAAGLAQEAKPADPTVAKMTVADAVEWTLGEQYEKVIVTVSGPFDHWGLEFAAGEPVLFKPFGADGQALPDGRYRYELRPVPVLSPEAKKALEAGRKTGKREETSRLLLMSGELERRPKVWSGVFAVRDGKLIAPDPNAKEPRGKGGQK
ncbi:MAG: hypothetical protein GY769_16125 [bacterium]|nr:hypothetical protein [bacterium]